MSYLLGLDPGFKNFGYALLKNTCDRFELVETKVYNPSTFNSEVHFAKELAVKAAYVPISHLTIERFVPFNSTATSEMEYINILIGSILTLVPESYIGFNGDLNDPRPGPVVSRVRSVEWKVALVKALVKKRGFDNPSTTLDKRFSMAAAACILGVDKLEKGMTDHEADSICLAAFPILCGTT